MTQPSVQELYAPNNGCFGCGPANPKGLQLRSLEVDGALTATWVPQPHHQAFEGILNGGIVGALLDCHCNWAAAMHFKRERGEPTPPCTVTADYAITLKRPCPTDGPVTLTARVIEAAGDRAVVEGTLEAQGKLRATCRGTFVAVKPGHPAYHRW